MYSIDKLIGILKDEDGYVEKKTNTPTANLYEKVGSYVGSDNWTKYWKDCADMGLTNYQGSYYCIATLFWAMAQAFGLPAAQDLCLQKFMINCQNTYELFTKAGQIVTTPQPGDIATFWNGSRMNHAEMVVEVSGDTVKTFGANTSAVTSTTVSNGGGCRYGKTYSLSAMRSSGTKFCRPNYGSQTTEGWVQEGEKWRYQLSDGTYATNIWKQIDGIWYAFDGAGYMITGWFLSNNQWYYLTYSGAMSSGWTKVGDHWYFMSESGEMHTGWLQDGPTWYYLKESDGTMACNEWLYINGAWYVFLDDGEMVAGEWFQSDGKWYYLSDSGSMIHKTWKQDPDTKWYFLTDEGAMATNSYIKDPLEDVYYFVDENGVWDDHKDTNSPVPGYPIIYA